MQAEHFADWLQGMMGPLCILLVAALVGLAALYLLSKARARKLARSRSGYDEHTFAKDMEAKGLDSALAASIYAYLRDSQNISFPMMPDDSLDERLGVAGRDLEETIHQCLVAAERQARPGLTVLPPATLEELVRYVQDSPKLTGEPQKAPSGIFPMRREDIRSSGVGRRSRVEPR